MDQSESKSSPDSSVTSGYLSEKFYRVIQLYIQNKGWHPPTSELAKCVAELEAAGKLPHISQVEMIAQRMSTDSKGRLILRATGKLILPVEHFANAVMLKHLDGPRGIHLGLASTIDAVTETYTIGWSQHGMEVKFITTVVQNCPNPACQFYINQLEMSYRIISDIACSIVMPGPAAKRKAPNPEEEASTSGHSSVRMISTAHAAQNPSYSSEDFDVKDQNRYLDQLKLLATANKDLLAYHHGFWGLNENEGNESQTSQESKREKMVRIFSEINKNMARLKSCIRPNNSEPDGDELDLLEKSLLGTIDLVNKLKEILPASLELSKNANKHWDSFRKFY